MRKMLATAAALGPLCIAQTALAETSVSTERTTPIATATATPTSTADDVKITSTGKVKLSTGAAVTLNSNNSVVNEGSVTMENATDGATGVLVQGGFTGNVTNTGNITVKDNYTPTDVDPDGSGPLLPDGDLDGPFATGTGRYGIRVTGASPLVGNVTNNKAAAIDIEGNESYGIRIEPVLQGNLTNNGIIRLTGNNGYGVLVEGGVTGNVKLGGTITTLGGNTSGAVINGDVGGALTIDGQISSTGYRYNTRPPTKALRDQLDADDLLQGGPAVAIGADVAGGVLFDAAQPNLDPNDDDEDDDGVKDTDETTANITSWGAAPGVQVGSTTQTVTLSPVGTGDNAYGLVNKGTINGLGVYDDVDATALAIGVTGGQAVTVDGGVRNTGTIHSISWDGTSTALKFNATASTGEIRNSGVIQAEKNGDDAKNAIAIDIANGATIGLGQPQGVIRNEKTGLIQATVSGDKGDAIAIRDQSGTVDRIENTGKIRAGVVGTDDAEDTDDADTDASNETVTGKAVAIDVSANTGGVVIRQWGVNDGDDGADGKADADADADGVDDADESDIIGAVRLGSGADRLEIANGRLIGDVSFGAGADVLVIGEGTAAGEVRGVLTDSDGLLDITVHKGVLEARNTSALSLTNLTVEGGGELIFTVDPTTSGSTRFNVSGTATFANGATLGVRLTDLLSDPTAQFVLVDATTLNVGSIDISELTNNTPYLYVPDISRTGNQLILQLDRRTAAEAGMIASEAAAYDAIYNALQTDSALGSAFLAQLDRDGFFQLYSQMLPDHSGGTLLSLASGVDAVTRALSDPRPEAPLGETTGWIQEINFYADKEKNLSYGFRSEGFGIAGGLERGTNMGAFGLSTAFTSSDIEDPQSAGDENLSSQLFELGAYWRGAGENWRGWARAAAGYAMFDSTRQLIGAGLNRTTEADWNGFTFSAGAGASYEKKFGRRWYMRPEATLDYFYLSEEERQESGGGNGFDLIVDGRDGHMLTGIAALNFGGRFGTQGWLTPELRLGWRQNISFDAGETIARFRSASASSPSFVLKADELSGGGPIIGFRLLSGNTLGFLALEGGAELLDDYARYSLLLRAGFRF
ncbi:autotransporter outer membrane beta-barrel domain-containing protein [Caulobacter sp. 17J80-11]|uniref:autotransporter family protein n=1 Tax=Caulobacter sp. 17J80-11 TaxID=2763502 RepID=UPI001653E023|nr:autotransporter outer membrane beta-barrel domain-containing protein [Caulobacter sp. 17J80-11]MBC6980719.1 autotransporter outer membrane beta-barrel domain-containing protein [Caulobacter sp. 17J80-11]